MEDFSSLTINNLQVLKTIIDTGSIVVEDRAPRVYPWVNERDGGILYA